eukprot:1357973-Rhodomonas_salina.2
MRDARLDRGKSIRARRVEGAEGQKVWSGVELGNACVPVDLELEGAVELVTVGVDAVGVGVVVGGLVQQSSQGSLLGRRRGHSVLHEVDRDDVIELQSVAARVGVACSSEVGAIAEKDQCHEHSLDGVCVDDHLGRVVEVCVGHTLHDPEQRQLCGTARGAHDNVGVCHVLEVRLGGDAIAEDVEPASHDGDGGSQGGLHLHGGCVSVRHASRARVQRVDDHVYEDVVAQLTNWSGTVDGLEHMVDLGAQFWSTKSSKSFLSPVSPVIDVSPMASVLPAASYAEHTWSRSVPSRKVQRPARTESRGIRQQLSRFGCVAGAIGPHSAVGGLVVTHVIGVQDAREVGVLVQNHDETHVDVLKERVLVHAVGGDGEKARLLQVDCRLGREGVDDTVGKARGAEVGVS